MAAGNNISYGKSAANKDQHLIQIYCPFPLQLGSLTQPIWIAPQSMPSFVESKTDQVAKMKNRLKWQFLKALLRQQLVNLKHKLTSSQSGPLILIICSGQQIPNLKLYVNSLILQMQKIQKTHCQQAKIPGHSEYHHFQELLFHVITIIVFLHSVATDVQLHRDISGHSREHGQKTTPDRSDFGRFNPRGGGELFASSHQFPMFTRGQGVVEKPKNLFSASRWT